MIKSRNRQKKRARKPNPTFQPAILIGVVLVVAVILLLKAQQPASDAAVQPLPTTSGSSTAATQVSSPMRVATSVRDVTPSPPTLTPAPNPAQPDAPTVTPTVIGLAALSPEAQVDRLRAEGKPIFAFFHSNTCKQCIDMTAIVEQVYPDFNGRVYLVDVNVYDKGNQNLLQRAGIRVIPTLIFINGQGEGRSFTGVMQPDVLREQLNTLAGGEGG